MTGIHLEGTGIDWEELGVTGIDLEGIEWDLGGIGQDWEGL